jgi:hypothetical protein
MQTMQNNAPNFGPLVINLCKKNIIHHFIAAQKQCAFPALHQKTIYFLPNVLHMSKEELAILS